MTGHQFKIDFDGTRYILTSDVDSLGVEVGPVTKAHLAVGVHTEAEHDSAIQKLRQSYSTVRQWAQDAQTTNTNWPTMTAAQKDNAMRETIRRLGVLLDHVGDLMITLNADQ